MKILTINTHSLQEENYEQKLQWFIEGILKEKPDIIAMQEVNQTADAPLMAPELLAGQYPVPGALPVRQDNHAANVALRLRNAGVNCYWAWVPIKLGYGKYDEGVAILSLGRPSAAPMFSPSPKCMTIRTGGPVRFWAFRWRDIPIGSIPSTWDGGTMPRSRS